MRISYWSSDVCSSDLHDVDALAVQFVAHRLNARAAHADAGADRIGAVVVGQHRDLGAVARLTRAGLDVDQALADFRHFELEQLHHEFRRGAADYQLPAARLGAPRVQVPDVAGPRRAPLPRAR